ncbi:AEC family transporter [Tamilnaduibacter salinus]|uniref:AEC family transporter n=1 Tax=Tamilnaduibacter salinus TaxID=1484056 RepID=UPI003C6FAC1E
MAIFLDALAPLFGLILVGALMRRLDFPGDAFWPLAERLTYYVLFPAMLFYRLGNAHVPLKVLIETGGFMALMLTAMIACLLVVQALVRWHGPVFSSFFQGGLRFNAFVGLAAAEALLGDPLLPVFAVAMAIQIPLINLACIVMFLCAVGEGRTGAAGVLKAIARNPPDYRLGRRCFLGSNGHRVPPVGGWDAGAAERHDTTFGVVDGRRRFESASVARGVNALRGQRRGQTVAVPVGDHRTDRAHRCEPSHCSGRHIALGPPGRVLFLYTGTAVRRRCAIDGCDRKWRDASGDGYHAFGAVVAQIARAFCPTAADRS